MIDGIYQLHDDVTKWKHFPHYWPFVRGIHRSPVNSLHKGQWRGALMFSLICVWINSWENSREAGDVRRNHAHYDVIVMTSVLGSISTRDPGQCWTDYHYGLMLLLLLTWYGWSHLLMLTEQTQGGRLVGFWMEIFLEENLFNEIIDGTPFLIHVFVVMD